MLLHGKIMAGTAVPAVVKDKNSSADEIANVNLLRRYRTRTSRYQTELTSFNKLYDS